MAEKQDTNKQRLSLLEVEIAELKALVGKLHEGGGREETIPPKEFSAEQVTFKALSDIATTLTRIDNKVSLQPGAAGEVFAVVITPACKAQEIELEAESEKTITATDYRCNELDSTETAAKDQAYDAAKKAVDDTLQEQIEAIQPVGGCTKQPGTITYTEVYPRKTVNKCIPPNCNFRCWYEGQAKVNGKVTVKIVPPP